MTTFNILANEYRTTFFGSVGAEALLTGAHTVNVAAGGLLHVTDTSLMSLSAGIFAQGNSVNNAVWTLNINGSVDLRDQAVSSADAAAGAGLFNGFGITSNTVTVGVEGSLYGGDYGLISTARGTVTNNGLISGGSVGIYFGSGEIFDIATKLGANGGTNLNSWTNGASTAAVTINNNATGVISGPNAGFGQYSGSGILSMGFNTLTVNNSGVIGGNDTSLYQPGFTDVNTYTGAVFSAGRMALTNTGTGVIWGNVSNAWHGATVTNAGVIVGLIEVKTPFDTVTGRIDGNRDGDYTDTLAGATGVDVLVSSLTGLTLTNSGIILGDGDTVFRLSDMTRDREFAVIGSAARDSVTNSGTIEGVVHLQGGNDTMSNSGNTESGIYMGDGDDRLTNTGRINTDFSLPSPLLDRLRSGVFREAYENPSFMSTSVGAHMGAGNDLLTTTTGEIGAMVSMGIGNDTLTGGAKSDFVQEDDGLDRYTLAAGSDYFLIGQDDLFNDTIDGGAGNDLLKLGSDGDGWLLDLNAGTLRQNNLVETVPTLSTNVDSIVGFEQVIAGMDNDTIIGSARAETISGGAGNDSITGGGGKDVLYGNEHRASFNPPDRGADVFVFNAASDSGTTRATRDVIMDFVLTDDKIHLTFDANTVVTGNQLFDYAGIQYGGFTREGDGDAARFNAGELRYHYEAGNTILRGDTNGDGLADFSIELRGQIALTSSDFVTII